MNFEEIHLQWYVLFQTNKLNFRYSCHCCLFENHIKAKEAAKTKYQLADFVKNRCVNQRQEIGIVIGIHEQNGYYNVRFGPEQSDIELKHAEEIIKI